MNEVLEIKHPLLFHHLSILRNEKTSPEEFRKSLTRITYHLVLEATKDLATKEEKWNSPLESFTAKQIASPPLAVSLLRAGEGMVDGFLELCPMAELRHLGLYRDKKENRIIDYYNNLPNNIEDREIYILDPMLATGDTALKALGFLKEKGMKTAHFLCILAANEGIEKLLSKYPETKIYTASIEQALNDKNYILPGLGDAGDRLFNT